MEQDDTASVVSVKTTLPAYGQHTEDDRPDSPAPSYRIRNASATQYGEEQDIAGNPDDDAASIASIQTVLPAYGSHRRDGRPGSPTPSYRTDVHIKLSAGQAQTDSRATTKTLGVPSRKSNLASSTDGNALPTRPFKMSYLASLRAQVSRPSKALSDALAARDWVKAETIIEDPAKCILLDAKALDQAFEVALDRGLWVLFQALLSRWPQWQRPPSQKDKRASGGLNSLLCSAVTADSRAAVTWLLAQGADPNVTASSGKAPLYSALGLEDWCLAYLLIDKGANLQAHRHDRVLHAVVSREKGNAMLKLLLDLEVDLEARDSYGWTALHVAAHSGRVDQMKLLLEGGANPNAQSNQGYITPLHVAAEHSLEACWLLLQHEAVPDMQDSSGRTPLWNCINSANYTSTKVSSNIGRKMLQDSEDRILLLLDHTKVDITLDDAYNQDMIKEVCDHAMPRVIARLADMGAKPGVAALAALLRSKAVDKKPSMLSTILLANPSLIEAQVHAGNSYLHVLAREDLSLLHGHLSEVTTTWSDGIAGTSKTLALRLFCEALAARNDRGQMALHIAIACGDARACDEAPRCIHAQTVRRLLGAGADGEGTDGEGRYPIHVAIEHGCKATLRELLSVGVATNALDGHGRPPLVLAVRLDKFSLARSLLEAGADVNAMSASGATAYSTARLHQRHRLQIQTILKFYGADLELGNERDQSWQTL